MTRLALKEDHTTTGGRVLGGSSDFYAEDGRPFALDGDKATCGNCQGLWPILGSAHDWMDDGRSMVKDLDPVHCPCGKNRVFASGSSPFDYEAGGIEAVSPMRSSDSAKHICWICVRDTETGKPLRNRDYVAEIAGAKQTGKTDAEGYAKIETIGQQSFSIHIIFASPKRALKPEQGNL